MPMTIRMECPPRQFELLPGTRGISNVHAFDGTQVGHGIILFENELGGRTIVVPYDGQQGAIANSMFTSVSRQKQFNAIVHYLNRDAAPHGGAAAALGAAPMGGKLGRSGPRPGRDGPLPAELALAGHVVIV